MELPPNFQNFLPLINYYRNVLNIDCLTSTNEKFRLYAGYHIYKTKETMWISETGDSMRNWYCSQKLVICYQRKKTTFYKNDIMFDELSQVLPNEINEYLKDIYPTKVLKSINKNKLVVIIKSPNDITINLNYQQFKLYCGYYHKIIKPFKKDFKVSMTIAIPVTFCKNTAECIEHLINLEDSNAYKNIINIYEYINVYDFLDVSFCK